ncbi:MAG: ATP-binding cassette domain-containing protein, partial [Eubacterium sp.]|nr:ATP-binding cassette domain-containing protein [Eubacterium sp.]
MPIIEVKELYKTFETKDRTVEALKNINFSVEPGDIYGIIGMSGAGKSTLVRCLNFLEVPTKGSVIVEGNNLSELTPPALRELRSSIGMIFQSFNLLMQSNVLDNVCFPLTVHGTSRKKARKKAAQLLKTVGLEDKATAYPAQLSGGQQQRVAIARALACDPKILLCDEATSALDPQTTHQILELLRRINQDTGITIIIITHSMNVVREICHNVAIVEEGEIVEDGLVEDIFTHPKSRAAKRLIVEGKDPDYYDETQTAGLSPETVATL